MKFIKLFSLLVFTAFISSSCNTYKKYTYLRDIKLTGHNQVIKKNKPNYRIQPGDLLYIRVITPDQSMGEIFNPFPAGAGSTNMTRGGSMYFRGYLVSDEGYIEIPVIDSIKVDGLKLQEVQRHIETQAKNYLKESQVIVKLGQFKFTLLGEVASPGVQIVYDNDVNLIEAISYGGGITYNGDRQKVLLIRATKEGTKTFQVDLTNNEIVKSDLYYVMPNDIIYVKPRRTTAFRQETSDYLFGISAISSILTTALLIWRLEF
jgi:polysaccharide export outer membrane protein